MNSLFFSSFEVTRQCFYRNPLSYAIVNLKVRIVTTIRIIAHKYDCQPIVPGREVESIKGL